MPDSTLEQAKRCPKCAEPGELSRSLTQPRPGGKGFRREQVTVNVYICKNERCRDANQTWIVQVNADGSIPERKKGPKEFPNSKRMEQMGKSYVDYLQSEVDKGEANGPF
jgi:hypothetical protein